MRRRARLGLLLLLASGLPAAARAQAPQPATPVETADPDDRLLRLSLVVAPVPLARLRADIGAFPDDQAGARTVALAATADFALGRHLFIGLAPQYVFRIQKAEASGPGSGREMDLRARVGAVWPIAQAVRMFGYLAPGYSLVVPSRDVGGVGNARGFVIAGALGATYDLHPEVFASGELGYQHGFQSGNNRGTPFDYQTSFLQIGVGIGLRL